MNLVCVLVVNWFDTSLFSTTVTGLQELINICLQYSSSWHFNFGMNKTKCMYIGWDNKCFNTDPVWYLKDVPIEIVTNLGVLDMKFNCNVKYNDYIQTRIQKCKYNVYLMSNIVMSYPNLNTASKVHLFKSIC